jgi:acetyltransferase-like isoleucine patch superfamily enzyme
MFKKFIQKRFRLRTDVGLNFYISHLFHKYLLHQNKKVKWAVHHTSTVLHPQNITRGKNVYPGDSPGNYIQAYNGIFIGDFTNIGPNVGLISADHDLIDNSKHVEADPIRIGSYCWIGMNAVILPSVVLGDFTIVGAGAVVTKSFAEGYCVVAGNPAAVVKYLDKEICELHRKSRL